MHVDPAGTTTLKIACPNKSYPFGMRDYGRLAHLFKGREKDSPPSPIADEKLAINEIMAHYFFAV